MTWPPAAEMQQRVSSGRGDGVIWHQPVGKGYQDDGRSRHKLLGRWMKIYSVWGWKRQAKDCDSVVSILFGSLFQSRRRCSAILLSCV